MILFLCMQFGGRQHRADMAAPRGQQGSGLCLSQLLYILSVRLHPRGWLPHGHKMAAAPAALCLYSRFSLYIQEGQKAQANWVFLL